MAPPSRHDSQRTTSLMRGWLSRVIILSFFTYWSVLAVFWTNEQSSSPKARSVHQHEKASPLQLIRAGAQPATGLPALSDSQPPTSSTSDGQMVKEAANGSDTSTVDGETLAPVAKLLPSNETKTRSLECIGWRNTASCDPDGPREPANDLSCSDLVPSSASGYCEVEDSDSGERFRVMRRSCNILRGGVQFRCSDAPSFANFRVEAHATTQKALDPGHTLPNIDKRVLKPRDGIVMVVYPKLVPSAYATIRALRDMLGCALPIEIWYRPDEVTKAPKALKPLERLAQNTSMGNISFHEIVDPVARRFVTKIYAISNSFFDRVLFLDADNVPVRDPSYLFDSSEFVETGAMFWPDFWHPSSTMFGIHHKSMLWELLDMPFVDMFEQESGQLLVDRRRHTAPLELVLFYAVREPNFFFRYVLAWGDKDLFRLAWLKLGAAFHMIETPPAMAGVLTETSSFCGMTMVQHDAAGSILFLHRNKHKLTGLSHTNAPGDQDRVESARVFDDPTIWTHLLSFRSSYNRKDYIIQGFHASLDFSKNQKCFGRRDLDSSPQFHVQDFADLSLGNFEADLHHFAVEGLQ